MSERLAATAERQASTRESIGKITTFLSQALPRPAHLSWRALWLGARARLELGVTRGAQVYHANRSMGGGVDAIGGGSGGFEAGKRRRIDEEVFGPGLHGATAAQAPFVQRSRSLGEQAADALPHAMQEATLHIMGSTDLQARRPIAILTIAPHAGSARAHATHATPLHTGAQDAAVKDMQRSDASFESMHSSELPDADDLEAYLWDFLEGA